MFPSGSYMDPYFSQNKEQVPYPSYPFYPYPVPRPDPSAQPASYAPWPYHFNPTHPNGYPYPSAYCGPRPPFPYEMPPPNFPNYYHPSIALMPNYPAKYPQVDHTTHQTHCCGCPNHVCHGHSPKVKIDDEMSDVDKTNMPNNSHPFFWFSPRNKVHQDEIEQPKKQRNGAQFPWPIVWMPEDGMKEKENKNTQFSWPIIWMPEDESKERKDQHANKRPSEEAAKSSFRIIPLKFLENGDKDQAEIQKPPLIEMKQGVEEARKDQMEQRDKSQAEVKKSIPVLEKKESSEKVGKEQPIKEKDSVADRVTEKKHSKLPPVCLRVDPLPDKRPTNGSSENKNKKEVRVVDVKSAKDERKGVETEVKKDTKENLPERKIDDAKSSAEGKDLTEREIQGEELKDKLAKAKVENAKRSQKSEQDAALLIQSAYRGYNVRRWDPLKKLKIIRSVQEKEKELLKKLQDVEGSSKPLEKKEQLVLSESIMNLLLQLDTIQGLHPTVREARKSVARELVSLQEKLDSLEKQRAVEMPTNEVSQPQMEVQPTATDLSSEGCKSVSEQVEMQASEEPTLQCIATQEENVKAHESLNKVDGAAEFNLPQSVTDFPFVELAVKNEKDASSTTQESQVTQLEEKIRPNDLTPWTTSDAKYPEEQLCSPQIENSQNVGSTENAGSDASKEVPSVAIESCATDLALANTSSENVGSTENVGSDVTKEVPSVAIDSCATDLAPENTSSESGTAASHTLSESEVLDTAVTSRITEEIHDTEIPPGVAVTEGIDKTATLPETKDLDGVHEEKGHAHASESNAEEAVPEVALNRATAKEVNMLEESHAGASVENVELQATEDGKPISEEMKAQDNEVVSDATVTASAEVELPATEVIPERGNVNDGVAGAEKVELLATEADEVKDENKSVEKSEVTALPGNEVTSIPGNEAAALPETENSEGFRHVVEVNEPGAEVLPDALQANATEVPPEVGKLSVEEKKLVEENEKLKVMLEKLMEAGRNQLDIISGLNERVKGLEKKLEKKAKKSKFKAKKYKPVMASSIEVL